MDRRTLAAWESWREEIGSTYARLETVPESGGAFGRVGRPNGASVPVSRVISTRQVAERTPSPLRSDPQDVALVAIPMSGEGEIEPDGRQSRICVGHFGFYETARPYRLGFEGPLEQRVSRLPRRLRLELLQRRALRELADLSLGVESLAAREGLSARSV